MRRQAKRFKLASIIAGTLAALMLAGMLILCIILGD